MADPTDAIAVLIVKDAPRWLVNLLLEQSAM
jgi:hypothetical protein